MKQVCNLLLISILLTACAESFIIINPKTFNQKINNRTDIKTPEDLIKLYYNYLEEEGRPQLTIIVNKLTGTNYQITLIREGLADDSQAATKIVMEAIQIKNSWHVTQIKENWKCYRGHSGWGTAPCE